MLRRQAISLALLTAVLPLCAAANTAHFAAVSATACTATAGPIAESAAEPITEPAADTVIVIDRVQVTAIKQGLVLRSEAVAATILGERSIERQRIEAINDLSQRVPNFHAPDYGSRMTSSIYVRGLGARIDQPVMGLNVDNVPVMNKDNYDSELCDVERIEVLRGPQSTLYGRNTMGGVINVYTISPLSYQGVRLGMEYSSGNSYRLRASSYYKITPQLGMAVMGYYKSTEGLFENTYTGEKCDWERLGGGRWKTQYRSRNGLRVDNTLSFSVLEQGGYPYAYIGPDIAGSDPPVRHGVIAYNDPSDYSRTAISDGLTVRYDAPRFTVASITSYQYSDDRMRLDQDFLPLSYFTLTQARREHSITQDLVFRSRDGRGNSGGSDGRGDAYGSGGGRNSSGRAYQWLFGAFGFYRHGTMEAPVRFGQTGVDELIFRNANTDPNYLYSKVDNDLFLGSDFTMPAYGLAAYHESNYTLGKWLFTAGLRVDYERSQLRYHSQAALNYTLSVGGAPPVAATAAIDSSDALARSFTCLLPKAAITYRFSERNNLYVSVSKGYKAGGFNTQIFSDILQTQLKWAMVSGIEYNPGDIMSYKPEHSWNYELGGHFSCMEGAVRGDFALFWIDCRDQQLTVFPAGQSTGRMMTNAGRTRSLGGELSLQVTPWRNFSLNAAYGYTAAKFVRYDNGIEDFAGKRIPYAPENTLSAAAVWTIPTGVAWIGNLVLQADLRGVGRIWWDEQNMRSQPFYTMLGASVRIEHPNYSLSLWGRNLADTAYDVFYFKSIGNEFVQRGRPRTFGVTLTINI